MSDEDANLVGQRIWLEYYDQNITFENAFTPQYCLIKGRFAATNGKDDWYLVGLEIPLEYEDVTYDHLLVSSRWVDGQIGSPQPTAVFIVLVPNPKVLRNPFEFDRSLYVAWGFSARRQDDIKRS